jgi:two-component system, cell cycle sensor histidine kinase and response regulator CckA
MPIAERPESIGPFPLDYVDSAVIVYGADTTVLFANESACRLLGWPRDQMSGRPISDPLWSFSREDGTPLSPAEHPVSRVLATGRPLRHALVGATRRTTGERVWVSASAVPELAEGGAVRRVVVTFADITERQRGEEERVELQEQLVQAQRMESVGQLAGGIAHDFNNILMVVKGYCELMRLAAGENEALAGGLGQIETNADRAIELTRQLLAFSRKQTLRPVVIDLNNLVGDMEHMLRRLIGEDVELLIVPAEHPAMVTADRSQIEQVLVNLAANARDSMPVGGKLSLNISWADVDAGDGLAPGPYIVLTVSDTGQGMDPETTRRIFEPFFSTKGEAKRSGLGLATVYGIVHQSGGTIRVKSDVGRGTTFSIFLPRVEVSLSRRGEEGDRSAAEGKLVLVVEDEPALRGLVVMMLEKLGYLVHEAGNGSEALRMVQEGGLKPDLLLTDVVMPGMSGTVLVERLRGFMPELKVMYMSGYADETILDHGVISAGMEFLRKPFSMNDLEERVNALLGPAKL